MRTSKSSFSRPDDPESLPPHGRDVRWERAALCDAKLSATPGHLRRIVSLRQQRHHRAKQCRHPCSGALDVGPEPRNREAARDARARPQHRARNDRARPRVEVEQRKRRPRRLIGAARRHPEVLAREVERVRVTDHAALRRTGGAGRVDQGRQVGGAHRRGRHHLRLCRQGIVKRSQHGCVATGMGCQASVRCAIQQHR
jgi:hypothetical protein